MSFLIKRRVVLCLSLALMFFVPQPSFAQNCTDPNGYIGTIIYNPATDVFQGCAPSGWVGFHSQLPAPPSFSFSFSDLTDVSASTLTSSDIVLISGVGASVPLSISGRGNPEFRNCSDATCVTEITTWGSDPLTVSDGQYLQLRMTSSMIAEQMIRTIVTDGTNKEIWDVTTKAEDCSVSPSPGDICADGTVYAGDTPDGNVSMYVTRCDVGMSWDGSNCAGTRYELSWNNGTNPPTITTGYNDHDDGDGNTAGLAALSNAESPYKAAQYCANLTQDGHSDWYLPARNELNVLYTNNVAIRNFLNTNNETIYWSSSENSTTHGQYQRFSDGSQSYSNKYNTYPIRCARHD